MKPLTVAFLLDETGSMQDIKDDTIGGFNAYLEKMGGSEVEIRFFLAKFDSRRIEKVCSGVPVKDVPRLTNDNYQPGASTPLIDSMYDLIKATESKCEGTDVLVVVQTDGYENASNNHSSRELKALVEEKQGQGWQFQFIGAGIDAWSQAQQYGFTQAQTTSYARDKSAVAFAAVGDMGAKFAQTRSAADTHFTTEQRQKVGDDSKSDEASGLTW